MKIGTDPEFFLYDTEARKYISAHDMLPGNKHDPYKVDCGAIQVDGTAVEFNIDAVETEEDFVHNIKTVLGQLRKMIPEKYAFHYVPIIQYPMSYFKTLPDSAKELGCDPDFSSYSMSQNHVPKEIGSWRTGSGHIHVGWTSGQIVDVGNNHFIDAAMLATQMDRAFHYNEALWDSMNSRRQIYYGYGGAFRAKPYGCEYRGLSNAWLKNEKHWRYVYRLTEAVFQKTVDGEYISYYERPDRYIRTTVQGYNKYNKIAIDYDGVL